MIALSIPFAALLILVGPWDRTAAAQARSGPAASLAQAEVPSRAVAGSEAGEELSKVQTQLASRPTWTEGWWRLSTLAYDANRFDVAVPALQKVVAVAPQMGIAWNLLGLSEFEVKQYSAARTHLERAASLANSDDPEVEAVAAYHLALLCTREGDFDQSTAILLKAFGAAPSAQVSQALGMAALRVPLLPDEVDPSQEALIQAVGGAVAQGKAGLSRFADLVTQHPGDPSLECAYGLALFRAGESDRALAVLREAARHNASDAAPWIAIAQVQQSLGRAEAARSAAEKARTLQRTSGPAVQQSLLARYARKAKPDGEAGWGEAMQAYSAGDNARAAQVLTAWLSQHPQDGTAWAVLGLSEFGLQQYDNALLHLQRGEALGLHGDAKAIASAQYTAGLLLLRSGDFEHASEILGSAHKLLPDDDRVVYALGLVLLRRGGLPGKTEADTLVQSAGRIQLLLQESRYDEAFTAFRTLLQQYPSAPFLHYAYGTALIALSEFDEAAGQMRAELVLSPNSALPYARLASIALREHTPAEALAPARRAVALSPLSAEAHYLLGRSLLETGDGQAAIGELEKARAINPGSPEVHFSLAKAYARADREQDAALERATFARLNELSEAQQRGEAPIYAGPRNGRSLSTAVTGQKPQ